MVDPFLSEDLDKTDSGGLGTVGKSVAVEVGDGLARVASSSPSSCVNRVRREETRFKEILSADES